MVLEGSAQIMYLFRFYLFGLMAQSPNLGRIVNDKANLEGDPLEELG